MITYEKIEKNHGCYDTRKYRYIIDSDDFKVYRTLLSNLDTTAMCDPNAWALVYTPDIKVCKNDYRDAHRYYHKTGEVC